MTETKFIDSIDARFPYGDPKKARELAARALRISPNAVFSVYHELARPGRGVRTSARERLAVLEYLEERFVHPLSGLGSWLTRKMIAKEEVRVAQAAKVARQIAEFPGCYGILNLAYFSCDDTRGKNEKLFDSNALGKSAHPAATDNSGQSPSCLSSIDRRKKHASNSEEALCRRGRVFRPLGSHLVVCARRSPAPDIRRSSSGLARVSPPARRKKQRAAFPARSPRL